MDALPSCSHPALELERDTDEDIEWIGEVKISNSSKKSKRLTKRKRSRRNSSTSIVSSVFAELKANAGNIEDKKKKKKKQKNKLERFDKPVRNPNDGEVLVDLSVDDEDEDEDEDEDVLVVREDDVIEIIEHIGKDSVRTTMVVDLTDEENLLNSESVETQHGNFTEDVGRQSVETQQENISAMEGASRQSEREYSAYQRDWAAGEGTSRQSVNEASAQISSNDPTELCKLYIGGLKLQTTSENLKDYFEKWGEVFDSFVKTDPNTNRSRGFGFVTFTHQYMVDEVQKNRPHIIDGRSVCCRRYLPAKDTSYTGGLVKKLFIPSLAEGIKEKDLVEYFRNFGEIIRCHLVTQNENGVPRSFSFVYFRDYDAVDKILLLKYHQIKGYFVQPRVCLSKEQMAERNLKYYLKYFGGFHNWSLSAIGDWIRNHPEIHHNRDVYDRNIENLRTLASIERQYYEERSMHSRTYSTSSSVTTVPTNFTMIERDRGTSISPLPSSQMSDTTSLEEKVKIKIEIKSDDEADMPANVMSHNEIVTTIKQENVSQSYDRNTFDDLHCSEIKTENMDY